MNCEKIRMRTAAAAYKELLVADPESCISERQIRALMKSGIIPVVHKGNSLQVNMDTLYDYFADPSKYENVNV